MCGSFRDLSQKKKN